MSAGCNQRDYQCENQVPHIYTTTKPVRQSEKLAELYDEKAWPTSVPYCTLNCGLHSHVHKNPQYTAGIHG